jgi:hypothetical protein
MMDLHTTNHWLERIAKALEARGSDKTQNPPRGFVAYEEFREEEEARMLAQSQVDQLRSEVIRRDIIIQRETVARDAHFDRAEGYKRELERLRAEVKP